MRNNRSKLFQPLPALLAVVGVLLLFTPSRVQAQANPIEAQLLGLNTALLRLQGQAFGPQGASARGRGADIIAERLTLLQALIQQDPEAALRVAFTADVVAGLSAAFPDSSDLLETHGRWIGVFEHSIVDTADLTAAEEIREIHINGRTLRIHFPGEPPDFLGGLSSRWKASRREMTLRPPPVKPFRRCLPRVIVMIPSATRGSPFSRLCFHRKRLRLHRLTVILETGTSAPRERP